jgi:hypothetical protein
LPSLQQTHADDCSSTLVSAVYLFPHLKLSSFFPTALFPHWTHYDATSQLEQGYVAWNFVTTADPTLRTVQACVTTGLSILCSIAIHHQEHLSQHLTSSQSLLTGRHQPESFCTTVSPNVSVACSSTLHTVSLSVAARNVYS